MSEDYQEKFHKRLSVEEVEEGNTLSPKFDDNGLMPCVTTDSITHEVLMVGYMNAEALEKQLRQVKHFILAEVGKKYGIKAKPLVLHKK